MQPRNNSDPMAPNGDDAGRSVQVPSRGTANNFSAPDREAAANVVRQQIDELYSTNPPNQPMSKQPPADPANPYNRTHDPAALEQAGESDMWNRYHSSWQNYYQQYYERYYMSQLAEQGKGQPTSGGDDAADATSQSAAAATTASSAELSRKQATKQIHDEIIGKIKTRAGSVRRSVHFMPIVTATVVGLMFMFVQYNRLFTAQVKAYVSPGSSQQQNIIVDPTLSTKVGPEPRVIIPKISVDVPIVYGITSVENDPVQVGLRDGVVHYQLPGANSVPGQAGNTVLLGHSSNDVFDSGDYKFAFVLLERLEVGDTFYIHTGGIRYTYSVTKKEVIDPSEVGKLVIQTDKPLATLVTCVPPGTALKRLVVMAEQTSPDPGKATAAPAATPPTGTVNLPDDGQTLLERLFGN